MMMLIGIAQSCLAETSGILCVSYEGTAAIIDDSGSAIVSAGIWEDAFCVSEGALYALGDGESYALCDASGALITDISYDMFSLAGGVILFSQDGLYGAMTASGEIILPAEYSLLTTDDGEHFLALTDSPNDEDPDEILRIDPGEDAVSTGILTRSGLTAFSCGLMPYLDGNTLLYGYLDGEGNVAIEPSYDTADDFQNGFARASQDGLLGIIDSGGAWYIEPQFSFLEWGEGVIVGLIDRQTCVVMDDESCAELYRIEGDDLSIAVIGSCTAGTEDGQTRVYDASGDIILTADASASILPGLDGQLILSDGTWGESCVRLADADGSLSERTDQYLLPLASGRYAFYEMTVAAYYSDSLGEMRYSVDYDSLRCGMMDEDGNEILPCEYLEIRALGSDCFLAIGENILRNVDAQGNILWSVMTLN